MGLKEVIGRWKHWIKVTKRSIIKWIICHIRIFFVGFLTHFLASLSYSVGEMTESKLGERWRWGWERTSSGDLNSGRPKCHMSQHCPQASELYVVFICIKLPYVVYYFLAFTSCLTSGYGLHCVSMFFSSLDVVYCCFYKRGAPWVLEMCYFLGS